MTTVAQIWNKYPVYSRFHEHVILDPSTLETVFVSTDELAEIARRNERYVEFLRDLGITPDEPEAPHHLRLTRNLAQRGIRPQPARVGGYRIVVTDRCNMTCSYCFVDTNTGHPDMSEEDLRAGLDYLFEQNIGGRQLALQWFGGEPTIRFDLMQLGDAYADELSVRFGRASVRRTVVTNAAQLTDSMIEHFRRWDYGVGISLDGRPDMDTRRRLLGGQRADTRILANVRRLLAAGIAVGCNLTPTPDNVASLPDVTRWIIRELGLRFIYVNTPIPAGGRWSVPGRELAESLFRARSLALSLGGMLFSGLDRVYQGLDSRRPHVYEHLQGDGSINVALLPSRRISVCDINWREPSFVVGIDELRRNPKLLARIAKPLLPAPRCERCPAMAVCGGPTRNEAALRKTEEPDPEMCAYFERAVELAVWDATGLQ